MSTIKGALHVAGRTAQQIHQVPRHKLSVPDSTYFSGLPASIRCSGQGWARGAVHQGTPMGSGDRQLCEAPAAQALRAAYPTRSMRGSAIGWRCLPRAAMISKIGHRHPSAHACGRRSHDWRSAWKDWEPRLRRRAHRCQMWRGQPGPAFRPMRARTLWGVSGNRGGPRGVGRAPHR
jgi:hypothetical protein